MRLYNRYRRALVQRSGLAKEIDEANAIYTVVQHDTGTQSRNILESC